MRRFHCSRSSLPTRQTTLRAGQSPAPGLGSRPAVNVNEIRARLASESRISRVRSRERRPFERAHRAQVPDIRDDPNRLGRGHGVHEVHRGSRGPRGRPSSVDVAAESEAEFSGKPIGLKQEAKANVSDESTRR